LNVVRQPHPVDLVENVEAFRGSLVAPGFAALALARS
jgi:hypothetical protein